MLYKEEIEGGHIWWTRLPRIPLSVEDAKSLPQYGPIVFICDAVIYQGRSTLHKLIRMVERKNPDWDICVWHNHRRDKMITRRQCNGKMVHAE